MHMELINNTFIPEKEIPRSRSAAGWKGTCDQTDYGGLYRMGDSGSQRLWL